MSSLNLLAALISLAAAIIGLVTTLAGRKQQVIVIREEKAAEGTVEPVPKTFQTSATESPSPTESTLPWYDRPGWLAILFIVGWPIALYGFIRSHAIKRGWKIAGFVLFVPAFVAILAFVLMMSFRSSWAYQEALALARSHPKLIEELGEPMEPGWFVSGSIRLSDGSGRAELSIPIEGPRSAATVHVIANKRAGRWTFALVEAETMGDVGQIDLLP